MQVSFKKGTNYSLLENYYNVPVILLNHLRENNVVLHIGNNHIALEQGSLYKEHTFNTLIQNTVKYPCSKNVVEVNAFVANFVKLLDAKETAPKNTPTEWFHMCYPPVREGWYQIYRTDLKKETKTPSPEFQYWGGSEWYTNRRYSPSVTMWRGLSAPYKA